VIVGRTADYILRENPNVVSVFLHAPEEECIKRIMSRHDCETHDKARSILRKTNRLRADFYNFYTDRTWGDAKSYHLTLDSSSLPPESIADIIIEYTKAYLSNLAK
jgi:cytidylate kinase